MKHEKWCYKCFTKLKEMSYSSFNGNISNVNDSDFNNLMLNNGTINDVFHIWSSSYR